METQFNLPNAHPGETLLEDFMKPIGLTSYRVATDIKVPINRIDMIVAGKRSITPDTAMRLGAYFKVSPEFWLNLQARYDLMEIKRRGVPDIAPCKKLTDRAA